MRRLPPVGSIQAFVHVARLGSIKAAADSLALSSPALTRRIQSLETFLGASLFERQKNAVQLNDRGAAFLGNVEPHIEAISTAIERFDEDARMHLHIAVPSLFASQRLMPALPYLRQRHPELVIDLDTGANRISRLSDGLDAAIAITDQVETKHYARLLERGRIVALGSRALLDKVRSPADLRRVPILLHRDLPEAFAIWRTSIGLPELNAQQISYFDAGQLILDAAGEGMGIAFMLESHLRCSADPRLVQFFGKSVESPYAYWFVCPQAALSRKLVKSFHDWLFDYFGDHADGGERLSA